jgi:hypothetical protein
MAHFSPEGGGIFKNEIIRFARFRVDIIAQLDRSSLNRISATSFIDLRNLLMAAFDRREAIYYYGQTL